MNFAKKFLTASSILGVLCGVHSNLARAESIEKVLTLSVGPSDLYVKDVPKLSLRNGPLAKDEKTIGVEFDKDAFAKLFSNKIIEQGDPVVYREARNFRDAKATFKLKQVDGTTTVNTKTFSLEPNAPAEGIIDQSEFLLDVDAEVTVSFDVYLCFKANNDCAFEKTTSERLPAEKKFGSVFVEHYFRRLLNCYSNSGIIEVRGSIAHPEILYVMFPWYIATDSLKVNEFIFAKTTPVLNGADFKGFTNRLGEFDVPFGVPGGTLKVTRENDKLRVARSAGGGWLTSGAENCVNYP